jgi:hypothetical protein
MVVVSLTASFAFLPEYSILESKFILPALAYTAAATGSLALTAMVSKSSTSGMQTLSSLDFMDVVRPVSLRVLGLLSIYLLVTTLPVPSPTLTNVAHVFLRGLQAFSVLYLVGTYHRSSFLPTDKRSASRTRHLPQLHHSRQLLHCHAALLHPILFSLVSMRQSLQVDSVSSVLAFRGLGSRSYTCTLFCFFP